MSAGFWQRPSGRVYASTYPSDLQSSIVKSDALERSGLEECKRAVRIDERYEALSASSRSPVSLSGCWPRLCAECAKTHDVFVRDVTDLLQDAAADDVANLFRRDFRMYVLYSQGSTSVCGQERRR